MEIPLKNLWTSLAQRIVQALLYPGAKTVQRNTKSRDTNLWHLCLPLKDFIIQMSRVLKAQVLISHIIVNWLFRRSQLTIIPFLRS
jgi:hypothetical protein